MKVVLCYSTDQVRDVYSLQNRLEAEKIDLINIQIQNGWEPVSGNISGNYRAADMMIICAAEESLKEKWFLFVYAFAEGAKLPVIFYKTRKMEIPVWMKAELITENLITAGVVVHDYSEKWLVEKMREEAKERLMNDGYALSPDGMVTVITEGNSQAVKLFLRYGISPNARDSKGVTMLGVAVRNRHKILADMFMSTGADVNLISLDRGNTALMDAASLGDTDILKDILKLKPDLNIRSKNGQSALILALGGKYQEAGQLLIEAGCDIGLTDQLGMNASGYAKLFKLEKILELLKARES